jgi:short-subunit dehydrogenase
LFKSRSLAAECGPRGVYVQSLYPGYVVSRLSGIRKPSLTVPTPEKFVLSALDRAALPYTTGYWTHEIQVKKFKDNFLSILFIIGIYSFAFTRSSFK